MTVIYYLLTNITSITGDAEGGNQSYQTDNKNKIGCRLYILPFFHKDADDIAEKDKH